MRQRITWPPPQAPHRGDEDDSPALALLANVVLRARRDAASGSPQAREWLQEWVEPGAADLVARGRVRVAA
jgi:hypothetical protein